MWHRRRLSSKSISTDRRDTSIITTTIATIARTA
jgi:hypothetical protein